MKEMELHFLCDKIKDLMMVGFQQAYNAIKKKMNIEEENID
jgi:hypothetical protein